MIDMDKKLRAMYNAITDVWKLYKAYCGTSNADDAKWAKMLEEATDIQTRHNNTRLIRGMVMAVLEQLEDDAKEMEHG